MVVGDVGAGAGGVGVAINSGGVVLVVPEGDGEDSWVADGSG